MNSVIPPIVEFVSDAGLSSINLLMKTILERHNMVWVAKSKIGLAFLTMFLSRAEILKQTGVLPDMEPLKEDDLTLWYVLVLQLVQIHSRRSDIYNFLFASIQGQFSTLFPEHSSKTETHPGEIYIWQFLASLAVGATSVDQQRILVTEVRSNVIETAKRNTDAKALDNVNLFLNALGLGIDASQLAAMDV